jgi:AcrR family transcriptional regulator
MTAEGTALRRQPNQRRSRERVERILECAREAIAREGSDALRMSEVARSCGISIGSLYQYFPDKSAVLRTLLERYSVSCLECIAEGLAGARSVGGLIAAFAELIDAYYALFLADPVMRDVWAGVQADKSLQALEVTANRRNAAILVEAMRRAHPGIARETLERSAFLIMCLGDSTMRLAVLVGREEGDALVEAYKRMAVAELGAPGGAPS